MPEGDAVFLAATRLDAALAGATLTKTDFRVPRYATVDLAGRTVGSVTSHGKHILLRIAPPATDHPHAATPRGDAAGAMTLHTHFRMEGSWHLYRPGDRWQSPAWQARVVLETPRWIAVGFRLPVVELLPTPREHDIVGALGPDPLRAWDAAEAVRRLRTDPARAIGETLLDQRVIAGPGNVYKCEICFLRGLDPWTPIGEIADLDAVVALTKRLFDANRASGTQVTTGDPRAGRQHWVYGRAGLPCRRCETAIVRKDATPGEDGERSTYWCPTCQPSLAERRATR